MSQNIDCKYSFINNFFLNISPVKKEAISHVMQVSGAHEKRTREVAKVGILYYYYNAIRLYRSVAYRIELLF